METIAWVLACLLPGRKSNFTGIIFFFFILYIYPLFHIQRSIEMYVAENFS